MNIIWSLIVIASIICSILLGNTEEFSKTFTDSAADATGLLISIAGIICLWSGLMKIAEKSGLTRIFSRLLSPFLGKLFPRLDKNGAELEAISMNISANLLGLGNTATPLGITAMKRLQINNPEKDTASDEMVLFVLMNTASLQLMPTMLASLRAANGSKAPFEILVPVWISSATALAVGLSIALLGNKRRRLCN